MRGLALTMQPALINGAAGGVSTRDGQPFSVGAFKAGRSSKSTSAATRRLAQLDLTVLDR